MYCAPNLSSNHSRFIRQNSLLWLQHRHLVAERGETGREMAAEFCPSASLSYLKVSLTCLKILRHGADGFTSPPKEVVLRIFIALKIHRFRPGLNPLTLSPMASTITITPPRTTREATRRVTIKQPCTAIGSYV
jgi:hypothetical protein